MSNVTQYIDKSFIPPMVWNILLLIVIAGGVGCLGSVEEDQTSRQSCNNRRSFGCTHGW